MSQPRRLARCPQVSDDLERVHLWAMECQGELGIVLQAIKTVEPLIPSAPVDYFRYSVSLPKPRIPKKIRKQICDFAICDILAQFANLLRASCIFGSQYSALEEEFTLAAGATVHLAGAEYASAHEAVFCANDTALRNLCMAAAMSWDSRLPWSVVGLTCRVDDMFYYHRFPFRLVREFFRAIESWFEDLKRPLDCKTRPETLREPYCYDHLDFFRQVASLADSEIHHFDAKLKSEYAKARDRRRLAGQLPASPAGTTPAPAIAAAPAATPLPRPNGDGLGANMPPRSQAAAGEPPDGHSHTPDEKIEWSKPTGKKDLLRDLDISRKALAARLVEGIEPVKGKIRYRAPTARAHMIEVAIGDLPAPLKAKYGS